MAICRSCLNPIFQTMFCNHALITYICTDYSIELYPQIPEYLLRSVSNNQPGCIQRCQLDSPSRTDECVWHLLGAQHISLTYLNHQTQLPSWGLASSAMHYSQCMSTVSNGISVAVCRNSEHVCFAFCCYYFWQVQSFPPILCNSKAHTSIRQNTIHRICMFLAALRFPFSCFLVIPA